MHGSQSGLIQVEYGYAPSDCFGLSPSRHLSIRGYWLPGLCVLASASGFHDASIHFENRYQSEGLAQLFGNCRYNTKKSFAVPPNLQRVSNNSMPGSGRHTAWFQRRSRSISFRYFQDADARGSPWITQVFEDDAGFRLEQTRFLKHLFGPNRRLMRLTLVEILCSLLSLTEGFDLLQPAQAPIHSRRGCKIRRPQQVAIAKPQG